MSSPWGRGIAAALGVGLVASLALLPTPAAGQCTCPNGSFAGAGRLRVPLGGNPTAMATGDWNGDGIPDVATAGVSTLSILTGDGTLGFSAPVNLALVSGSQPKSIAVADFDLDGDPDLAVTSPTAAPAANLELYRNVGGAFTRYLTPTVGVAGTTPNAVVAGDFNRDGTPDIVTGNNLSLSFLPGRGDGTFGTVESIPMGPTATALAAGDVDGDLLLDIVFSTTGPSVQWWKGNGAGGFAYVASYGVGTGPVAVALGDLSGDGRPDLAVANSNSDNVSVLLNNGTGFNAATAYTVGTQPRSVVIGNANGDAAPDLVVANRGLTGSHDVTVLFGNGSGGFPTSDTVPGYDQPWPLALLDADRNGKTDLAVANWSFGGGLVVVPGDGLGGFGTRRVSPAAGFRSFATGDFDGDGRPDLVTFADASPPSPNLSFLKGQGDGSFAPGVSYPTGLTTPRGPGVGDFDGDGDLDLVVGDGSTNQVAYIPGDGGGGFGLPALFATGGTSASLMHIAVGDFDLDGALDLAKTSTFANSVSVLFGDGAGGFTGLIDISVGGYPTDIVVLEFNRDGTLDLAVSDFLSDTISLLEGSGTRISPFTLGESLTAGDGPTGLAAGDFDGDGATDLVVSQMMANPGTIGFFHAMSAATSPPFFDTRSDYTLADTTALEPDGVAAADLNGDGWLDVLAVCRGGSSAEDRASVRVLPGTGSPNPGAFGAAEVWTVSQRNPSNVAVEDFNLDGKPDLATGELLATTTFVSVVLNSNCEARRLRVTRQVSRCNAPLTAFPTQPAVQVEDDGANPIECNADPVGAAIVPSIPLSGTNPLATVGGVADWALAATPLSADGTGTKYRLEFDHPTAGLTWSWTFSISPALTVAGPTVYCAADTGLFSANLGFDTYRWLVDLAGPLSYLPSLSIPGGTLVGGLHNARVDAVVDTCPATANQDFTVHVDLSLVSVSPAGPHAITTTETVAAPLAVTDTGGGPVTHKWGYRTVTGGLITFFPGETTASYTIEGADFPGQGIYYVVVETTPQCGVAIVSNEVEVRVAEATPGDVPPAFTVTSTNAQNRLEWIYPVGIGTVRIRYFTASGPGAWNLCIPPANDGEGFADIPDQSGPVGGPDSFDHTGLTNDQVYCYSIFAGVSGRRSVKGRPFDNTVGRVKWAFSTGASALAPPGLGAGILHVLSDETLYAVVKGAGGGMWPASWMPFTANGPSQSRPSTVPLAVGPASRVIYLGSGNAAGNNAIAVDADTGLGLWGQPLGAPTGAGPAGIFTAYGGAYDYILLGNRKSGGGSAFFALDRATGALAPGSWPYLGEPLNLPPNEIGIVSSQAALDRPNRRAYFTSYQRAPGVSDSVWCVDLDTAARCGGWTIGATSGLGDITASPTLQGGRLYVAALNAGNAEVHALDANDGVSQWASPFAPADGPVKLFILPDVFTHDLYFSTTDNVWSIRDDGGTATQRWARYLPGASQPVYFPYDRLVWVGGGDGQLYTLNRTDGSDAVPPVTLGDGSAPAGAPTVDSANGFVYVGTTAGVVYAVSIP